MNGIKRSKKTEIHKIPFTLNRFIAHRKISKKINIRKKKMEKKYGAPSGCRIQRLTKEAQNRILENGSVHNSNKWYHFAYSRME
jgi:hypothetical protein